LSTCRINRCYHVWCSDQPCQIVACNPANGQCEGPPKPDGTACDDGSVCTQTDSCQAGQCLGSRPLDCTAKNGCQLDGTCDPAIGCVIPHLPDGTSCDDGTPCTTADACEAGECVGVVTNACFVGQVTPIDPISPTSLASSTAFLYSGSDAVQKGVAPGTIDPVTVAVLRGSVKTRDGTPISGIRVTIGQHPEFGETRTRENGVFDIAVNGGGELTLVFERRGYLRVERRAFAAWQDYTVLPDVVMTALDPVVTTIDLPSSLPQIAIGSEINDEDGRRQPMLLVPSGVSASMAGPDVSVPLNRLSVRLTEYTVGLNGPAAMPAPLPANSGYTYAVELSADEAIAANVVKVYFSKPLYFYVDNFLNLAVGASAPTGTIDQIRTLDNGTSTWEASASGRVVKVLAVINGMAELAVDGSGLPATAGALLALGVTDEERAQLARSFEPGKTLWRIPIAHFSSWDINLPYGYPHGIEYPHPDAPQKEECDECNDQESGSIIECENQVLGQEIQVAGTPFSLAYRSRESDGDKRPQTVSVPLGAISPAARALLKGVEVKLSIAGQIVEHDYSATSYPTDGTPLAFSWNGIDAYGRQVQGAQRATVTVGYKYPIFYRSQADLDIIFGEWATPPASIVSRQAATVTLLSDASNTSGIRGEPHLVLGSSRTPIGELGGWTLSAHHVYDPQSRVIYRGDGTLQTADDVKQVVRVIGGDGHYVSDVDPASSGPALQVPVDFSGSEQQRLAVGANGDVLFDDVAGPGRIDRAGNLTRAALTHYSDYYDCRTVGSDGRVCTLGFGRDVECRSADSLTVLLDRTVWVGAQFGGALYTLAPAPDGSVYLGTDNLYSTVFKLTLDGQVRQVAGTSQRGYSPDGTPAAQAQLDLWDIAVGSDGSLFINEATRIRRIGPDGILTTVAGTGVHGSSGDGGPATQAQIWARPEGIGGSASAMCGSLRVASDQTVYFMEQSRRIRRIGADGIISTYAGSGQLGAIIDGSSARSPLRVSVIATSPDGSIVFSGPSGYPESLHVYRISPPLPGYQASQTAIASKDGQEIYVFDAEGRHLRTEDARTGTIVHRFGYTAAGALASITDRDGLVTAIERDASGQPVAVVAPNGQRTTLTLDQNGYIASIADPDGNTHQFTYSPDGLMKTLIDPNQKSHTFEYDDVGRLKKDTNPAGGFFAFSSTGAPDDHLVTKTSAEGKSTSYHVQAAFDGSSSKEVTDSAGLITVSTKDPSGKSTISRPDGTVRTVELGPDPRYGMQMPVVSKSTVTMPSGKSFVAQQSRTTTTAADGSLASQVDTTTVNGKSLSSTYDATAHTVTDVSPLGRQTVSTLDDKGRVVQVQAGSLAPTAYAYDSRGRLATVTVGSGTSARVTTFSYDSLDRLASVTDPLLRVQSYVYDDANRVVGQVFTDGSQVGFSYDANGNVTSVTPPSRPEHDFRYTPADLMSSYTPPAVSGTGATTYEYNRDKQPTVVHRPDGSTINFTYDSAGRLSTVAYPKGPNTSDGTVTVTRTYNTTTGKLASVSTSDGQSLSYGYDGKLLLSTTWSGTVSGSVSRTFNNDFRMASQSVNGVNSVAFGYDNDGLLTSVDGIAITRDSASGLITDTTLGQVTDHRTYDTDGLLATYEAKFAGASLYSTAYVRDSLGRIEQKTETIQGTTVVWNYSYDSAGRLWQVMQNGVLTATYLYDANGNRTSVITAGGTQTATYDAQDRLLTYGDWSYTYTANGDLQSKTDTSNGQVTNYAYDAQGNLRHVGLPDGRSIDYVIDGENRRVAKKINGVLVRMWIYKNQLKPVAEFDGAGNLLARYIDWVTVKGSTSYRVLKDGLGTPRLVVNGTTGAVAQRLDFDEWGQVAADSSAGFQVFGFAGGIYDPDTGLVRFGARDYDPVVGRWTAKDPIRFAGGQAGLYVYVMNDPINNRDSGGLGFFDWCMNAWHWLTSWSFSQKYNEAIHSSKECVEGQLDLVDKMSDGEATDEDNNAAQAKCTKSQEDTKETIKKGAEVVTESYMQE
jgi:RHS repeat-associated protein